MMETTLIAPSQITRAGKPMADTVATVVARASASHRRGDLNAAERDYRSVLSASPHHAEALTGLGAVLLEHGDLTGAAEIFRAALVQSPSRARAHYNLGVALNALGELEEAGSCFNKALMFDPKLFQAMTNLGSIRHAQGRMEQAVDHYKQALRLKPDDIETLNNLALVHRDSGDFVSASTIFERAVGLSGCPPEVHRNRGLLHLLHGDYERGWASYERRWQCRDMSPLIRPFPSPRWTGEIPARRESVLVWGEQGLGDEILFASMIPDATRSGAAVILETDPRLRNLFAHSFPDADVVARATPPLDPLSQQPIGWQLPSGSLGPLFRRSLSDFPVRDRYLIPDAKRVSELRSRIATGPGPVVGLAWMSRHPTMGHNKSSPLAAWAGLLSSAKDAVVDLQYGDTSIERESVAKEYGAAPRHFDDIDLTNDIDTVAALITACDRVVTVSNTVAHLAGALGVPTTVVVPAAAGKLWYWGHVGEKTPWYPTVRLVRGVQGKPLEAVIGDLAMELARTTSPSRKFAT